MRDSAIAKELQFRSCGVGTSAYRGYLPTSQVVDIQFGNEPGSLQARRFAYPPRQTVYEKFRSPAFSQAEKYLQKSKLREPLFRPEGGTTKLFIHSVTRWVCEAPPGQHLMLSAHDGNLMGEAYA